MKLPDDLSIFGFDKNLLDLHGLPPKPGKDLVKFIADHFQQSKTTIYKCTSYGLKHLIEHFMNRYIPQGELIRAMAESGYQLKRCNGTPQCRFYMRKPNWEKIAVNDIL